jgi:hypothetical protein
MCCNVERNRRNDLLDSVRRRCLPNGIIRRNTLTIDVRFVVVAVAFDDDDDDDSMYEHPITDPTALPVPKGT